MWSLKFFSAQALTAIRAFVCVPSLALLFGTMANVVGTEATGNVGENPVMPSVAAPAVPAVPAAVEEAPPAPVIQENRTITEFLFKEEDLTMIELSKFRQASMEDLELSSSFLDVKACRRHQSRSCEVASSGELGHRFTAGYRSFGPRAPAEGQRRGLEPD